MRIHKNLGHPRKELLCRAVRIGGANEIAIRAANALKCDVCAENKPRKSHLPSTSADTYTELNQGLRVDLFVLADFHVLSVLEMVWINWAGPMSHLVSDMGGEFEGELGELMEAHGIRQRFTASEAPWQRGLVGAMAGSGKQLQGKQSKMSGSSVEDTNCHPWSLLDQMQNGELAKEIV